MRLLMEIQYHRILFGKGANISELINAFDGAKLVDEKGGYGEPKKYEIQEDVDMRLMLINDEDIRLPENQEKHHNVFHQFHVIANERDALKDENKNLKEKLKNIEEATQK